MSPPGRNDPSSCLCRFDRTRTISISRAERTGGSVRPRIRALRGSGRVKTGNSGPRERHFFSTLLADTAEEKRRIREIETVIFPSGATTDNERNDVEIAFNAGKYGAILVTADGDLLDHRRELSRLGIRVLSDAEAVVLVERKISERDERAKQIAQLGGLPIPSWVGHDSLSA